MVNPNEKRYTLPSRSEIMRRLRAVGSDYEGMFPFVASRSGKFCSAWDIVLLFDSGLDLVGRSQAMPKMRVLRTHVPEWIDALVDDRDVAEVAKGILKKDPFVPRFPSQVRLEENLNIQRNEEKQTAKNWKWQLRCDACGKFVSAESYTIAFHKDGDYLNTSRFGGSMVVLCITCAQSIQSYT